MTSGVGSTGICGRRMKIEVRNRRNCPFFCERPVFDKGTYFQHCMVAELYTEDPIECEGLDSWNCFVERYKEVIVTKAPRQLKIEEKPDDSPAPPVAGDPWS